MRMRSSLSRLIGPASSRRAQLRRAGLLAALAWVPLCVLAVAEGAGAAFLRDFTTHVRLLVAVPLLALVPGIADGYTARALAQFDTARLIPDEQRPVFDELKRQLAAALKSRGVLVLLLALAYALAFRGPLWPGATADWATGALGGHSLAGWWRLLVAVPLSLFLLLLGVLRVVAWAVFVVRASRLPLALSPLHPDCAGGLLFLGTVPAGFRPLLLAGAMVVAASVAQHVVVDRASVTAYGPHLAVLAAVAVIALFGPYVAFMPTLRRLRERGIHELGLVGQWHGRAFTERWIAGKTTPPEGLLGSPDMESLANLDEAFGRVEETRVVPCSKRNVLDAVAVLLLPVVPLALVDPTVLQQLQKLSRILL